MIASGKRFPPRIRGHAIHRREDRTWPLRYVVHNWPTGWNECERCGREHRVWICSDATWRRLPRRLRRLRLCTFCFRKLVKR